MTVSISMRAMQASDAGVLYELAKANMPFPWSRRVFSDCLRDDYYGWVAMQGDHGLANEVAGFAVALMQVGECQLLNLCVKSSVRRQGFALALLDQVADFAREKKCRKLFLEVRESNAAAVALYQRYGFLQVGLRKNYYATQTGRENALLFSMRL